MDFESLQLGPIDISSANHWIWHPSAGSNKISSAVYHHLNHISSSNAAWQGWSSIWHLFTAPRIKHFLWLLLHGRLSTIEFLFLLNMGPNSPCVFCGLSPETIDHLFCLCSKVSVIWSQLSNKAGVHISFPHGFYSGAWITDSNYSLYIISAISATAWFIWKSRCDAIFRNVNPNFPVIVLKALAHV